MLSTGGGPQPDGGAVVEVVPLAALLFGAVVEVVDVDVLVDDVVVCFCGAVVVVWSGMLVGVVSGVVSCTGTASVLAVVGVGPEFGDPLMGGAMVNGLRSSWSGVAVKRS